MQGTKEVSNIFVALVQGLLRIWQFTYNFHPLIEQAHAEHLLHTGVCYKRDRLLENCSGENFSGNVRLSFFKRGLVLERFFSCWPMD